MTEAQPELPLSDQAAASAAAAAAAGAASQASQKQATGTAEGTQGKQADPVRPDYLPEKFWDAEKKAPKVDEFRAELDSLQKLKAETDARLAAVPAKPEDYKPELPKDSKLPDGITIDEKDPRFAALRAVAHEEKWTQAQFSRVLKLEADRVATEAAQLRAGIEWRDKQLGEKGAERVEALHKWIDSFVPDKNEAMQIKASLWTPANVKLFEQFQKMATGQGLQGFSGTGRDDAERNDGKPEGWEKMSPIDKRTYNLAKQREAEAAANRR